MSAKDNSPDPTPETTSMNAQHGDEEVSLPTVGSRWRWFGGRLDHQWIVTKVDERHVWVVALFVGDGRAIRHNLLPEVDDLGRTLPGFLRLFIEADAPLRVRIDP